MMVRLVPLAGACMCLTMCLAAWWLGWNLAGCAFLTGVFLCAESAVGA